MSTYTITSIFPAPKSLIDFLPIFERHQLHFLYCKNLIICSNLSIDLLKIAVYVIGGVFVWDVKV